MKTFLALILLLKAGTTFASLNYYPLSVVTKFNDQNISKEQLRETLFEVSDKIHVIVPGKNDILADSCPARGICKSQAKNIDYNKARKIMFGELFLNSSNGVDFYIKDVYCNQTFDKNAGVGPGKIPNPKYLNCEHTWPQSKFTNNFPIELQKSDLHHLFPSEMKANSTRNNHPFAEVAGRATHANCTDSQIGQSIDFPQVKSFEPPAEHKGNVARALIYFSTRYKVDIPESEMNYLRVWNIEDPVDAEEIERNNKIMEIQGNRNPLVDYPELITRL